MSTRSRIKKIIIALVPYLIYEPIYRFFIRWEKRILHRVRFLIRPEYPLEDMEKYLEQFFPDLHLDSSSFVLDLGANDGWFSELCSRRGASVVAFEPNPYTFLRAFRRLSGCERVAVMNVAVSGETGWSALFFPPDYFKAKELYSGSGSLEAQNISVDSTTQVPCLTLSLSSILDPIEHVTFMKVDIEGHEKEIWPTVVANAKKIEYLAIETHERLVSDASGWRAEAEKFILENGLEKKWTLNWP